MCDAFTFRSYITDKYTIRCKGGIVFPSLHRIVRCVFAFIMEELESARSEQAKMNDEPNITQNMFRVG